MADQSNIQSAASKSIRPFRSSEEYLWAMKEDLAEWINTLYDLDLGADSFLDGLASGCALCRHANTVNRAAQDFQLESPDAARSLKLPSRDVVFQSRNAVPGSFVARDNVSNFISWCRRELGIQDALMFETNDLVERCNEKNLVLCLLEVARRGAKFGMLAPMLIQLEEEIEEEIRDQESLHADAGEPLDPSPPSRCFSRKESRPSDQEQDQDQDQDQEPFVWPQKRVLCDMRNLDELVREILGRCSCPAQFPMVKVSEGKYKVGDSSALIFIRVLRTHVMVRVGGGWDTLEHYLDKHDPCRCAAFAHRYHQTKGQGQGQGTHSKSSSAHSSRSTSPGPHWRNDAVAPHKAPERRSLEPLAALCASSSSCSSSSSSSRPGRSHPSEADPGAARPLLPRPPCDRSEPRHFHPLRNKETLPVTRRLSGDSDSSTASSKGGGGGGRPSLGAPPPRRSGQEVVLLVSRKEGRHVIERSGPPNRTTMPRARSQSRERSVLAPGLKPSPPQEPPDGARPPRTERGRSMGNEGPRRLHAPRSQSQSKISSRTSLDDHGPGPPSEPRAKGPLSSLRGGGGIPKRQSTSCSNSPLKGAHNSNSTPSKKTGSTARPPAPRSPLVGKGRLLPPVTSGGRRSPHSSPRHAHHPAARPSRTSHGSRSAGRGHRRNESEEGPGLQTLPPLDPQREQDLYKSFEAEFLANTQQARGTPGRVPARLTLQRGGAQAGAALTDLNVTDSAYSSSNSSSSSLNVGAKIGTLPDLRESSRTSPRPLPLEEPLNQLYGNQFGPVPSRLPAISSSVEDGHAADGGHVPSQPAFHCRNMNGQPGGSRPPPQADLPPSLERFEGSGQLPPTCQSPVPPPPSDDVSFQDSSSENSSMCFSLSESRSASPPPLTNGGDTDGEEQPIPTDQKKPNGEETASEYKLGSRFRPRVDNRPENRRTGIPTPVSYRQARDPLSPTQTPPLSPQSARPSARTATCKGLHHAFSDISYHQPRAPAVANRDVSFPGQSGGLDSDWM